MDIVDYLQLYRDELTKSVIPFWEDHCIDEEYGGFFTFLDRDGSIYDTDKYMWMQWRIVYQFATLFTNFEKNNKWLEIAKKGYDFETLADQYKVRYTPNEAIIDTTDFNTVLLETR